MKFEKKVYDTIGECLYTGTHESGLKVLVMPKRGFGKSYALFATHFGSVNNKFKFGGEEIALPDGIAHFLEHKLFEEPDGNAFDKFFKYGASANAFTTFDMTAYLFSATSAFYENLEILLNFVQNPYFTDENVSKEQGIIAQEITMYRDDAGWCVFFNMLKSMYSNHPIKIDIAGSTDSISKIDKDLLYQCYHAFYNPQNMVLFVVGDVDAEKVADFVSKCIKKTEIPKVETIKTPEPENIVQNYISQKLDVARPMFCMGFKENPMPDAVYADAAYGILLEILFSKSSPLYEKLYEENLVSPSFSADYSSGGGYAFVGIESESDDPVKTKEIILAYVENAKKNGINTADFERAKKSVYGRQIRALNNIEGIAGSYVSLLLRGGDYLSFAQTLSKITHDDIIHLLQGSLTSDKCVLSVISPSI